MTENTITAIESSAPIAPAPRRASFIAPRKELLAALRGVKNSASRRGRNDQTGVKIGINGVVELRAENGEQSARFAAEWDHDGEMDVVIDPQAVINALNGSKAEIARVEIVGESVRVVCGAAELNWNCEAVEHLAPLPVSNRLFTIDVAELRRAVEMTEFATDVESCRYALGGICVEKRDGDAVFVATDSRRLSAFTASVEWTDGAGEMIGDACYDVAAKGMRPAGVVLPVKFWETLLKLLPKAGRVEFVAIDRPEPTTGDAPRFTRFYAAMVDGVRVETLLIEGRFPRWRDVVPSESSATWSAEFDAKAMAEACKSVIPGTDDENRGVDFIPRDDRSGFGLKAKAAGGFCPAKFSEHGEPMPATYDARFIGQACAALKRGAIVARVVDRASPIVLTAPQWLYVVMPVGRD